MPEGDVPYGDGEKQQIFSGTLSDNIAREAAGGESATGQDLDGRNKTSTLCNLFEAVIGYMSIEIGINKTEKLLIDLFKEKIEKIYNSKSFYDSKSLLQEKLQEEGIDLPDYVSSELEDGNFNVDLFIQNKLITSTKARRKIDAEKSAAQIALDTFINKEEK